MPPRSRSRGPPRVLEYWMEFSARFDEGGEFDFLELDCHSRLMAGVVALLRNIVDGRQA
jgi:hypothetical protein